MIDDLRCPISRQSLVLSTTGGWHSPATDDGTLPIGPTAAVLATSDGDHAYPVVDGIPILLAPERLNRFPGVPTGIDTRQPPYAESYAERRLYSSLAAQRSGDGSILRRLERTFDIADPAAFPEPPHHWHDGGSTASAYAVALRHLAPVAGLTVLQIGGVGTHAFKLLHAGAHAAMIVSPVLDELRAGRAVAAGLGIADRCTFVCALAEFLPLADGSIDRIFSGSSIHHTVTGLSFPECARVLTPGGRFSSLDVWRNGRLYDAGIALFGKRHGNAFCRALDADRLIPAGTVFTDVDISHHGWSVRYGLSLYERRGRKVGPSTAQRLTAAEEAWGDRLPRLRRLSASLVVVRGSVR